MRAAGGIWLVLVVGCRFSSPFLGGAGDDGPPPEAGGEPTADAQACFGPASGNFTICLGPGQNQPFPTDRYDVSDPTKFDTGTTSGSNPDHCTFTQAQPTGGGPPLCVKTATSITVSSYLRGQGNAPMVLLATGDLTVDMNGLIDVSSRRVAFIGYSTDGAGALDCGGGSRDGASNSNGGGGGAGASYGGAGGDGGTGAGGAGGAGTATPATPPPADVLNGGCDGASGGSGDTGTGGPNGNGGGAVYLVAGGKISINGKINASGASARGGSQNNNGKGGGGGGGAGGMIVLFSPQLVFGVQSVLMANGAGGGGGATSSSDGGAGLEPDLMMPMMPAKGGAKGGGPGGAGGLGGDGGVEGTAAKSGGPGTDGGAGGGGGVGFIRILSGQQATNAIVSPAATN